MAFPDAFRLSPLALALLSALAQAQASADSVPANQLEPVIVRGAPDPTPQLSLDKPAQVGSRLNLSNREIPAAIDVIDRETIEKRGARTVQEAASYGAGVTYGFSPGAPGVFSTRGFSEGQVTILTDGIRINTSTMTTRPLDAWNYERIEIIKGPASVLSGEGAIGGAVNYVTKRAAADNAGTEIGASYGSFDTWRGVFGTGGALAEKTYYRVDLAHQRSKGWIDDNDSKLTSFTSSLSSALTRDVSLRLSFDVLHDKSLPYWGTPLVPASVGTQPIGGIIDNASGRVIDERTRNKNYNVADADMQARQVWARADLDWRATDAVTLRNQLYAYDADRRWRNAEWYSATNTGQVQRDFADLNHAHQLFGNRFDASLDHRLFGRRNRVVAGLDVSHTDFGSTRYFSARPLAGGEVDLFNPVRGPFIFDPAGSARTRVATEVTQTAVFAENALDVVERVKLVFGARFEDIRLKRKTVDLNTEATTVDYTTSYNPLHWRVGTVWDAWTGGSLYAQYSRAADPVATMLLLNTANGQFDLTRGRQVEVGLKQSLWDKRGDLVLSVYDIERDGILTRDPANTTLTVQGGQQSSQGVELSLALRPTRQLGLSANVAYVDAQFDQLREGGSGISRAGNTPPNVAAWVANLWTSYRLRTLPLELGAGLRHVGDRYGDNANSVKLKAYTLGDLFAAYRLAAGTQLSVRVRNVTDERYVQWLSPSYPNQALLGEPRAFELAINHRF